MCARLDLLRRKLYALRDYYRKTSWPADWLLSHFRTPANNAQLVQYLTYAY